MQEWDMQTDDAALVLQCFTCARCKVKTCHCVAVDAWDNLEIV